MKKSQWPAAQGLTYEGGRPKDDDILTRRPISFWDRIKWLFLLAVIWLLLVWSLMADNPLIGFVDAVRLETQLGWWVFVLAGLELLHQAHFLISEHSAAYNQFWVHKVWGRSERLSQRKLSAWTRYRIGRIIRWVVVLAVIAIIAGKIMHDAPLTAVVLVPAILWHALPTFIQYAFLLFFTVAQFALLFWFMSRGGVDVYYPDDIKTRFTDVWGQDHVLERVKENIIFLEHPELVEDRGGYVPGGILLWGPPGTGKTLMAEAVAGETGKPYVFVDPGAFINMFMGVGILKVKSLFRKLRKLSLRYGGVIVFFDEADSLGNRGIAMGGAPGGGPTGATPAPFATDGCHGFSYLSSDTQWLLTRDAMRSDLAAASDEPRPPAEQADGRRHDERRHGRRRHGHPAGAADRAVGPEEAARVHQPGGAKGARHAAQAAAALPDPDHDGDQHAVDARRGAAAPGPHRPHVPGRLPVQEGPHPHLRGVLRQGRARADRGADRPARHDHPLRDRRHASRTWSTRR